MSITVKIVVFLSAFIGFSCLFYRVILSKEYAAYKSLSRRENRHHNWLFFFLSHQYNPNFAQKYGQPTKEKLVLIVFLSLGSLALFAQYLL